MPGPFQPIYTTPPPVRNLPPYPQGQNRMPQGIDQQANQQAILAQP